MLSLGRPCRGQYGWPCGLLSWVHIITPHHSTHHHNTTPRHLWIESISARGKACSCRMRDPNEITSRTAFVSSDMPVFGLRDGLEQPFRVYVLRCGPKKFYVGIERPEDLKERLQKHFQGQGALFTQEHPATEVCAVVPASSRAAEALVYFALLEKCGAGSLIGGWVQTCPKLTPLGSLLVQEARANMQCRCFSCGSSRHFSEKCPKKHEEKLVFYRCKRCKQQTFLNSRGITPYHIGSAAEASAVDANACGTTAVQAPPQSAPPSSLQAAPQATSRPAEASVRKRPAGVAGSNTKSFEECWSARSVRKRGRFACVSDFLVQVNTVVAKRFRPTAGERLRRMSNSAEYRWGASAIAAFPEFRARRGGGKKGLGGTKLVLQDLFKVVAGT